MSRMCSIKIAGHFLNYIVQVIFQWYFCPVFQFEKPGARDIDYPDMAKEAGAVWTSFKYLTHCWHTVIWIEIWMFCFWFILLWHRRESADWCWNQVYWRPASMCRLRVWYVIIVSNYGYCIFDNISHGFNALHIDLYFVWYQCWVYVCFLYFSRWLDMWPKGYLSQSGSVRDPNN